MFIIRLRKFFVGSVIVMSILSILILFVFPVKIGIDFKGGSVLEVAYTNPPDVELVKSTLLPIMPKGYSVQKLGDTDFIISSADLTEDIHNKAVEALKGLAKPADKSAATATTQETPTPAADVKTVDAKDVKVTGGSITPATDSKDTTVKADDKTAATDEKTPAVTDDKTATPAPVVTPDFQVKRFNSIGPSIGSDLRNKAILSLFAIMGAIILFVAYAFRKVSKPVSSWTYGFITVATLIHDVLVPTAIYILLGHEINSLYMIGVLSILGLSVSDTIVVFDRIRENLRKNIEKSNYEEFHLTVGRSVKETIARSINTSLMLVIVLIALLVAGPASTHDLATIMLIGIIVGTYSSIFLASPLLVLVNNSKNTGVNPNQYQKKKK